MEALNFFTLEVFTGISLGVLMVAILKPIHKQLSVFAALFLLVQLALNWEQVRNTLSEASTSITSASNPAPTVDTEPSNNNRISPSNAEYIVTSDKLSAMVEPNNEAKMAFILNKNDKVKVLETRGKWVRVLLPAKYNQNNSEVGVVSWVEAQHIKLRVSDEAIWAELSSEVQKIDISN